MKIIPNIFKYLILFSLSASSILSYLYIHPHIIVTTSNTIASPFAFSYLIIAYDFNRFLASYIWNILSIYLGIHSSLALSLLLIVLSNSALTYSLKSETQIYLILILRSWTGVSNNLQWYNITLWSEIFTRKDPSKILEIINFSQNFICVAVYLLTSCVDAGNYFLLLSSVPIINLITLIWFVIRFEWKIVRSNTKYHFQKNELDDNSERFQQNGTGNDINNIVSQGNSRHNQSNQKLRNPNWIDNVHVLNRKHEGSLFKKSAPDRNDNPIHANENTQTHAPTNQHHKGSSLENGEKKVYDFNNVFSNITFNNNFNVKNLRKGGWNAVGSNIIPIGTFHNNNSNSNLSNVFLARSPKMTAKSNVSNISNDNPINFTVKPDQNYTSNHFHPKTKEANPIWHRMNSTTTNQKIKGTTTNFSFHVKHISLISTNNIRTSNSIIVTTKQQPRNKASNPDIAYRNILIIYIALQLNYHLSLIVCLLQVRGHSKGIVCLLLSGYYAVQIVFSVINKTLISFIFKNVSSKKGNVFFALSFIFAFLSSFIFSFLYLKGLVSRASLGMFFCIMTLKNEAITLMLGYCNWIVFAGGNREGFKRYKKAISGICVNGLIFVWLAVLLKHEKEIVITGVIMYGVLWGALILAFVLGVRGIKRR